TAETFHLVDQSIISMVGIVEDVIVRIGELTIPTDSHVIRTSPNDKGGYHQVLLGRPFFKITSFRLNYYDESFSFSVGNVIEIFQPTRPPILKKQHIQGIQPGKQEGKNSGEEIEQRKVEDQANTLQKKTGSRIIPSSARKNQKKESTKVVKKEEEAERMQDEKKSKVELRRF
ncbi:hypothetical protein PIB30_094199, partial [Stylosanthes scabra]|nr:hypothetical protein [Stylosanthes scabra]